MSPREVGERLHLDLLAGDAAVQADPSAGWRYVDASDPAAKGRLVSGAGAQCPSRESGDPLPAWRCLTGEATVDVTGAGARAHLFVVLFPVPPDELAEFDEWFGSEHAPLLAAAPMWSRARLVALVHEDRTDTGPHFTRMAVHDIQELSALDSEDRRRAGGTQWTAELFSRPWAANVHRLVLVGA